MKPLFVCCAAAVLLSAASATFAAGEDTFIRYTGTATALRGDKFLYHEEHVMHFHGGQIADRVVLYTCRDGTAFARKTVSYVDELSPDFLLEDASNGMRQGSRTDAKGREILFQSVWLERRS